MNIHEAFIALDEGKAIKRESCENVYYSVKTAHFPELNMIDSVKVSRYDAFDYSKIFFGAYASFPRKEIEATDWIIYERPRDLPT